MGRKCHFDYKKKGKTNSRKPPENGKKIKVGELPAINTLTSLGYRLPNPDQYVDGSMSIALTKNTCPPIICKAQEDKGSISAMYYFRDQNGQRNLTPEQMESYAKKNLG